MIRSKAAFGVILIMMISASILGCTNQQSLKVVNETSTSKSNSSETNKTVQTQQMAKAPSTDNSKDIKVAEETFYGHWQIEKVLAYGPVGTYSNDDIKTIIGKELTFSKDSASCFGDQVDSLNNTALNPVYKKSVIFKNDFESSNRMTFDKLGIKGDSITEIDAADAKGNGCTFFIKDNNTLILFGGGAYFELIRI
ncbi:hypothetical protein [Candidatus Clostridium radicumherbarum]|uniref:Lipocalin-like domain-containing protein n=1 Tax=Candidatus Clostridium radicumherbarum TaxID=3381662 RepID=A0ABW8TSA4_9CLOT